MQLAVKSNVRLTEEQLLKLLDRLDGEPEFQEALQKRKHARYQYRAAAVSVELRENDDITRTSAPARNLSAGGISLLMAKLVYTGTEVRLRLVSEHNTAHMVNGKVVRCRYLSGTAGVHEVGVSFTTPIDIAMFVREANSASVLVVEEDEMHRKLFSEIFKRYSADVRFETAESTAHMKLIEQPFDLVVFGFHTSRSQGCELSRKLRELGYLRPIMGMAMLSDDGIREHCGAAQCQACAASPLNAQSLVQLVRSIESEPIVSFRAQDPTSAGLIATFVQSAASRVAALEQGYAGRDVERVKHVVQQIVFFADAAGFEPVADAGKQALETIEAYELAAREVRDKLATLVQRCRAVRAAEANAR